MWRQAARPLFLLLFVCMWMTAAAEMGPDQWFPKVMGELVPQLNPAPAGRAVPRLHRRADVRAAHVGQRHRAQVAARHADRLLAADGLGLYWLGGLDSRARARSWRSPRRRSSASARRIFWPTMIGVTAEQFPRGGALLISLMGGAGMLSVGRGAADHGRADRSVRARRGAADGRACSAAILAVIFGGLSGSTSRRAAAIARSSSRPIGRCGRGR